MAIFFDASNSERLEYTGDTPATGYPFIMGCWVRPTAAFSGTACLMSIESSPGGDGLGIGLTSSSMFIHAYASATGTPTTTGGWAVGVWHYVLGIFANSRDRRICTVPSNNAGSGYNTNSDFVLINPTVVTFRFGGCTITGAADYFDGAIAECFVANWPSGTTSGDMMHLETMTRTLAWHGPWSIPWLANNISMYCSFLESPTLAILGSRETQGRIPISTTLEPSSTTPVLVDHPPLSATYERPRVRFPSTIIV